MLGRKIETLSACTHCAPESGRTFLPNEERPGEDGVIVLSHRFWSRRFGADRQAIGRTIVLDGTPVQIIAGGRDTVVPLVNAEFLAERLPHSTLMMVDAGHSVWEEAPGEYASIVTDWVERRSP